MDSTLITDIAEGLAGELVRKQELLGDSFFRSKQAMGVVYPNGIDLDQFGDALIVSRVMDKLCAISHMGSRASSRKYWLDILGLTMLRLADESLAASNRDGGV